MTYLVAWGRSTAHPRARVEVTSVADLDVVLTEVARVAGEQDHRYVLTLVPAGEHGPLPAVLQIGVGHPTWSFALWYGPGGGYGHEAGLEPGPAGLQFDQGGQPTYPDPQQLRVTPEMARTAAREYLVTGQRPQCLRWTDDGAP